MHYILKIYIYHDRDAGTVVSQSEKKQHVEAMNTTTGNGNGTGTGTGSSSTKSDTNTNITKKTELQSNSNVLNNLLSNYDSDDSS